MRARRVWGQFWAPQVRSQMVLGKLSPLAFASLALIGAAPAAPNWATTVIQGANGAYVMGNPKAKVKLVEYASYTCGHCAHFAEEASTPLKRDYVAKGNVSFEFRNAVRDQFDMTAALLARCGGAGRFFGNTEALMASQSQWLGKAQAFLEVNNARLAKLPPAEGFKAIMRGVGLDTVMKARGFTVAQLDACLISKPSQDRVVALTKQAWQVDKISGTPSFKINGIAIDGGHWDIIEGAIKSALSL